MTLSALNVWSYMKSKNGVLKLGNLLEISNMLKNVSMKDQQPWCVEKIKIKNDL